MPELVQSLVGRTWAFTPREVGVLEGCGKRWDVTSLRCHFWEDRLWEERVEARERLVWEASVLIQASSSGN